MAWLSALWFLSIYLPHAPSESRNSSKSRCSSSSWSSVHKTIRVPFLFRQVSVPGGGFGQTGFLTSTPSRARTLPLEVLDTVGQAHPHQMVGDLLACSSFQMRKDGFHHILACEGEAAGQYEGV